MRRSVNMDAVWERTLEFVSDNLGAVLAIALPLILLPAMVGAVADSLVPDADQSLRMANGLFGLVLALIGLWGQAALIALAIDDAGAADARGKALRRMPAILAVSLLLGLAVLLLFVPMPLILAAAGVPLAAMSGGESPQIPPAAALWLVLYLIVIAPVLIVLGARLVLVLPVLVDQQVGLRAFRRSIVLTRGLTLRIIGVIVLFLIVSAIVTGAVAFGLGSVLVLVLGRGFAATITTGLALALVSSVLAIIQSGFVARLYHATVMREQGAVRVADIPQ